MRARSGQYLHGWAKSLQMVSELAKCLDHGGGGSTLIILLKDWQKKSKKSSLRVRGSVGSPTSTRHGLIEVNIYG